MLSLAVNLKKIKENRSSFLPNLSSCLDLFLVKLRRGWSGNSVRGKLLVLLRLLLIFAYLFVSKWGTRNSNSIEVNEFKRNRMIPELYLKSVRVKELCFI